MKIKLNGETVEVLNDSTVSAFAEQVKLDKNKVVIELNGQLLRKTLWDSSVLKDGDSIVAVVFVGGG